MSVFKVTKNTVARADCSFEAAQTATISAGDIYDFDEELSQFNFILDLEEINIIVYLMISEWITRQLATVDVTRQRYSSQDFEFTSQANHLAKLINLKTEYQKECKKIQRLYKRRKLDSNGYMVSNYSGLGGKNAN